MTTNPFPGMDPYLEGYLWPDVHHRLAAIISELIAPKIAPKYVARVDLYTVDDTSPEEDVGIMYPDVEVLRRKKIQQEVRPAFESDVAVATPVTTTIPAVTSVEVRIPIIEIRDRDKNQLITAIEIISPINKRKPGLEPYRGKRVSLHEAGVHLLEIDLLRRGTRPFAHPYLPKAHYIVTLVRAGSWRTEVWAVDVKEPLPVLPVPLKKPDPDVTFDLGKALRIIYERNLYYLSIDYHQDPPPPEFSEEDQQWMRELLKKSEEEA